MAFTRAHAWYAGAAAGAVGVLAAGYLVLVSPQMNNASDISTQVDTVNKSNQRAELQIAALKREYANLPELEGKVASIRVHLPTTPQEPTLLRQLSALASQSGVKLISTQVAPPQAMSLVPTAASGAKAVQAPGTLSQIGLGIQITGSFAQTRSFLNKLENLPRSVLVTALDISRQGDGASASYSLTTTITARTFMASDQASAATTTTPAAGTTGTSAS
jgi:Tfp pilus assembly protein PilO